LHEIWYYVTGFLALVVWFLIDIEAIAAAGWFWLENKTRIIGD
jgi:hypothetical protein